MFRLFSFQIEEMTVFLFCWARLCILAVCHLPHGCVFNCKSHKLLSEQFSENRKEVLSKIDDSWIFYNLTNRFKNTFEHIHNMIHLIADYFLRFLCTLNLEQSYFTVSFQSRKLNELKSIFFVILFERIILGSNYL